MRMDSNRIEELLKKYWECETSLEEEEELKACFGDESLEEQFREASLFRYFNEQRERSLRDVRFDHEMLSGIRPVPKGKLRKIWYNGLRIAAGVIVLVTAVWLVRNEIRRSTPTELVDTYNDPQLAFEETKKALLMISRSFGTAEEQARKINYFNEARQQIQGEEDDDAKSKSK